ncbi:hypothetical protein QBC39DRAFT_353634 [Podospora conica]|nr:hypothetical protein QBC39DRAFT_353634 [Schizothecium conicum]
MPKAESTTPQHLSFWQWFQGLRKSPTSYGIPQGRTDHVHKLLDAFFPAPACHGAEHLLPTHHVPHRGPLRRRPSLPMLPMRSPTSLAS